MKRLLQVLPLLLLLEPALASELWVVDPAGGGDFTELQAAIDAASEGDALLLLPGSYGAVVISGKSLHLVGQSFSGYPVLGEVLIENLGPDQQVLLNQFLLRAPDELDHPGLTLRECQGSVRLQGCSLSAWEVNMEMVSPMALIENCRDVAFTSCAIWGRANSQGTGLHAVNSRIVLMEGQLFGPGGLGCLDPDGDGWGGLGLDGSDACVLDNSFLFAAHSKIYGGSGADCTCGDPGDGGDALLVNDSSEVHLVDCDVRGGGGGVNMAWFSCPSVGAEGERFVVDLTSSVEELEGDSRLWKVDALAFPGGTLRVQTWGSPGDRVFVIRGMQPASIYRPALSGMQLLATSPKVVGLLGVLDLSGYLDVRVPIETLTPRVGPGTRRSLWSQSFLLQMYVEDADGDLIVGSPAQVLVPREGGSGACLEPIHVRAGAPAGGDGATWQTAYSDLQQALDDAATTSSTAQCFGVQRKIWLASGVYTPSASDGGGPPEAYLVQSSVAIYGGFGGDETSLEQRDPLLHPTILDGDVLGDDGPNFENYADNARGLIDIAFVDERIDLSLDGLTLRGGYTDASGIYSRGGALNAQSLYQEWRGELVLRRCLFTGNLSGLGGAVYAGPMIAIDCEFEGNRAELAGGAVYCTSHAQLINCRFLDNQAGGTGGALAADTSGGSVGTLYWRSFALNCLFAGNSASWGGAISSEDWRTGITGCVLLDNHASTAGGGLFILGNGQEVHVRNSILWGNTSPQGSLELQQLSKQYEPLTAFEVDHSCIEGWSGAFGGGGNHGLDPMLSSSGVPAAGSPVIDAGGNTWLPADRLDLDRDGNRFERLSLDLNGAPRFQDDPTVPDTGAGSAPLVDMGAYESPGTP